MVEFLKDAAVKSSHGGDSELTERVGAIIADYPWGQAVKSAIENTFEGSGIEYTIEVAPVPPSTDFTPFVRSMSDFDAEMIIATGHLPGNSAIVTLSADLHDVPVSSAWTPPDLTVGGLQELAIGRVTRVWVRMARTSGSENGDGPAR